jgi:hypothetical protein
MDTKKILIVGAVAVLGVGAYFYFKPKSKGNKTDSSGGALGSTSGNSDLSSNTTTSSTSASSAPSTQTSTLSAPPTQTSVTINDVVLTTPAQVVETAFKISEAKSIASKIFDLRNKKNRWANLSMRDYATESNKMFWYRDDRQETMLKIQLKQDLAMLDNQIKELDNTLALLGYMEVNGSIAKI